MNFVNLGTLCACFQCLRGGWFSWLVGCVVGVCGREKTLVLVLIRASMSVLYGFAWFGVFSVVKVNAHATPSTVLSRFALFPIAIMIAEFTATWGIVIT